MAGNWEHCKIRLDEKDVDQTTLAILYAELEAWQPSNPVVYIEQPWMNVGFKGGNPLTTMRLVAVAQSVAIIAKQLGYRVEWVPVVRWRSKVFGKGVYPKPIAKELSKEWAREHTGLDITDDNLSDACCIAHFGYLMEKEAS